MKYGRVFLIRHAQSAFNFEVEKVGNDGKKIEEIRWDLRFFDPDLSSFGVEQAYAAQGKAKDLGVRIVFVSPFRRALRTAEVLFERVEGVRIVVHPLLAEQVSHAPDVSLFNGEPFGEFRNFDWSLVGKRYFLLDFLEKGKVEHLNRFDIQDIPLKLFETMKKVESPIESDLEIFQRAKNSKNVWKKYAKKENIALVGHSNFFKFYSMKSSHDEKFYFLKNCEIIDESYFSTLNFQ
jgi:broad specificity phosphatase PhoE